MEIMRISGIEISPRLLEEERQKGARLSVNFRWVFILMISALLFVQYFLGHEELSQQAFLLLIAYILSNTVFWLAARRHYNPRYLSFTGATIDAAVICVHLYGMASGFDYTAVTAAATVLLIPIIFLIYTFRLDRGLMYYLVAISVAGFNIVYFIHYFHMPEFYQTYVSLSPMSHIFKSAYITFIGLFCIHMQYSLFSFLARQLAETREKTRLDTEIKIEQERTMHTRALVEKERSLNRSLEEQIHKKNELAEKLEENRQQINSIVSNLLGFTYRCMPDESWTMLYLSDQVEDVTGYSKEELTGSKAISYRSVVCDDDIDYVGRAIFQAIADKKQFELEYRIVHKKGTLVWVYEAGRGVYNKDGEVQYIDGIITNISEKKRSEKALVDTKNKLEQLNEKLEKTVEERTARLTEANTQLLKLQKENLQSQFEVLKQQVNPHFLFNSLNVLTSLIKVNPDLAEMFTERLSKVYRHVLENKDKDIVTLGTEMDFIKAYIFLLDIRFSQKVFVKTDFSKRDYDAFVVPLALQLIIENAIKHNTFSRKNPLNIELFIDSDRYLNVVNNLQNRRTQMSSTGVGLVNISKRYALLTDRQPIFEMTDKQFIAKIPLIFRSDINEE